MKRIARLEAAEIERARLEAALRESVANGLGVWAHHFDVNDGGSWPGRWRLFRAEKLLNHWSAAARAGRLDWAICEAMDRKGARR